MQTSVQTLEGLARSLTVQVPAERVDEVVAERLQSLRKSARINGFRPGKVPLRVVEKRYGGQVRQEVLGEVISSSCYEALGREALVPAGRPRIEDIRDAAGDDLEYKAVFEVYPEVVVGDLGTLAIKRPRASLIESDVDEMLDKLREQHKRFEAVERAAATGDEVLINFTGYIDGEAFEGGAAENAPLVLGSGAMIEGFEEQIIGMSQGEQRQISVAFPDNYHADNLSGKAASFDIEVLEVRQAQLPALDEAFAARMGVQEGGEAALRADIQRNMERELQETVESLTKKQVMDALLDLHHFEVPQALIEEEIERVREGFKQRLAQQMQGQVPAGANFPDEMFSAEASRRVKLGLIVAEVVKAGELAADDERVRARVESIAGAYEDPSEVIDYYYANEELLSSVKSLVLEQVVTDWVLESAQVSEESMSFNELMERRQQAKSAGSGAGEATDSGAEVVSAADESTPTAGD